VIPAGACVVGATGGSGTRVVAKILRRAGMFVGAWTNEALDALPLTGTLHLRLPLYVAGTDRGVFERSFLRLLDEHLEDRPPGAPWGWKSPRTIYAIEFLAKRLPGMRFLQVVRDGRDMAFSGNQQQVQDFGPILLPAALQDASAPERAIALWSRVNCDAADTGQRLLGDAFATVRFEDLCARPVEEAGRILRFFGLDPAAAELARDEVRPPETIGRWRSHEELAPRLEELGHAGLVRFGYLDA
jgi:hypothetical protein